MKEMFKDIGYQGSEDFLDSCFHVGSTKPIMLFSVTLGTVATFIEEIIGLEPMVYVAFVLLLVMEFVTGIKASLREGKKIESKKFGRFIFKISSYTIIIGIVNIFRTHLQVPEVMGMEVNIWHFIYYTTLNMVILQLVISVFENLTRLGHAETNLVFKTIHKKLNKWLDLDEKKDKTE